MARLFIPAVTVAYGVAGTSMRDFVGQTDATTGYAKNTVVDGIEFLNTGGKTKQILVISYDGTYADASAVVQIPYEADNRYDTDDRIIQIGADTSAEYQFVTDFPASFFNQVSGTGQTPATAASYCLVDFYYDGSLAAADTDWTVGVVSTS